MRTPFAVLVIATLVAACSSPATSTGGGASDAFSVGFDGSTTVSYIHLTLPTTPYV